MRFEGNLKTTKITNEKASVMLENARYFSKEGEWQQWNDYDLMKSGKYKKGDVWLSAWANSAPHVYDGVQQIERGSEVEGEAFKPNPDKPFWNIRGINMKLPEVDVNEEMPPDMTGSSTPPLTPEEEQKMIGYEIEEERASSELDKSRQVETDKTQLQIIRQTCLKAGSNIAGVGDAEALIKIARRLERFVLEGK